MVLPVEEVENYLNTPEMQEVIQEMLNDDRHIEHEIKDTAINIFAYRDADLEVRWTITQGKLVVYENIETKSLQSTIKQLATTV